MVIVPMSDNTKAMSVQGGQLQPNAPVIVEPINNSSIQTFMMYACRGKYFLLQSSVNLNYVLQVKDLKL